MWVNLIRVFVFWLIKPRVTRTLACFVSVWGWAPNRRVQDRHPTEQYTHPSAVQYRHPCTVQCITDTFLTFLPISVQAPLYCTVQYWHSSSVQNRHRCTVQYSAVHTPLYCTVQTAMHTCTAKYRSLYIVQYRQISKVENSQSCTVQRVQYSTKSHVLSSVQTVV